MLQAHFTFALVKRFVNKKMCSMNMSSKTILSCEEVNKEDMVDYLSFLGFEPKRISGHQYWYLSPFRSERTASFKINRNVNGWYDFGEGRGGTLIDFGIRYFKCSVYDFLHQFFLSPAHNPACNKSYLKKDEKESSIEISNVKTITSLTLLNYLKKRKIEIDIARTFCKEVSFHMNDKNYFAIGFENDSGGYELRNSFFKGSTHPKGITLIQNNSTKLMLFEGFFDFLSYQTLIKKTKYVSEDYCILNSLSFLRKAKELIQYYNSLFIFFDRDNSGIKATQELMKGSDSIKDESGLYKNHKDLNEWLVQFGLLPNPSLNRIDKLML